MSRIITALRIQERNKERVSVFVDGEYAFSIPLIEAARLTKGHPITDEQIAQLQAIDERQKAFDSAVRFLGQRPRSQHEIRQKLREKAFEDTIIDEVLSRLATLGYVNDEDFARYWVRNREEFRPRSPRALQAELREKGIAREIIDEVIEDVDPVVSARQAAQKKLRSLRGVDAQTFRRRLGDYLARRGFTYDTINTVIEEYLNDYTNPEYEE